MKNSSKADSWPGVSRKRLVTEVHEKIPTASFGEVKSFTVFLSQPFGVANNFFAILVFCSYDASGWQQWYFSILTKATSCFMWDPRPKTFNCIEQRFLKMRPKLLVNSSILFCSPSVVPYFVLCHKTSNLTLIVFEVSLDVKLLQNASKK